MKEENNRRGSRRLHLVWLRGKMERKRQIQDVYWHNSVREAELVVERRGETNQGTSTKFLLDHPDGWQCQCHQYSVVLKRILPG